MIIEALAPLDLENHGQSTDQKYQVHSPIRPSRADAEAAVHTLLRWAGDDPEREGLLGTPERVVRAFEEFFAGYTVDPVDLLQRTFEDVEGYEEVVILRDIHFESYCEHH